MNVNSTGGFRHKSGFVAVVGRANAGKSTLINCLIGEKISIVSDKPQTTRQPVNYILTLSDTQIILIDTPGGHIPSHKLGDFMMDGVRQSVERSDIVCYCIQATDTRLMDEDREICKIIRESGKPVLLLLSKVDLAIENVSMERIKALYANELKPTEIISVSALRGFNIEKIISIFTRLLPEGPSLFPEDDLTDQPMRFVAAEIIREKVLEFTEEEVPHSAAVVVEEFKTRADDKGHYIRAIIYVEREGQKRIVIGNGGAMIKEIGKRAREDIEDRMEGGIFLDLWVKVRKNWRKKLEDVRRMGYN